jgi:GNAT superfamily N-acetyltransferase
LWNWRDGIPSFWPHHTFGSLKNVCERTLFVQSRVMHACIGVSAATADVVVHPVTEPLLVDVADMRAAAAFEDAVFDRLASTKKKKFASQELARLQRMHGEGRDGTGPMRCLVAVVNGEAVGSVDFSEAKDEMIRDAGFDASDVGVDGSCLYRYVDNVVVREDWRGQGIGGKLMEAVEEVAISGILLVRVELNNTDAVRLYSRMGYEGEFACEGSSTVGVFSVLSKRVVPADIRR